MPPVCRHSRQPEKSGESIVKMNQVRIFTAQRSAAVVRTVPATVFASYPQAIENVVFRDFAVYAERIPQPGALQTGAIRLRVKRPDPLLLGNGSDCGRSAVSCRLRRDAGRLRDG